LGSGVLGVTIITTIWLQDAGALLRLPPRNGELERDAPALREPKEVDVLWLPVARHREVREDGREERDGWSRVWARDGLAKVVEGGVPLVGLFVVEEGDSAGGVCELGGYMRAYSEGRHTALAHVRRGSPSGVDSAAFRASRMGCANLL